MNRDRVHDLLGQLEDAASSGADDVERGMPKDDVEELLADLQTLLDQLHAEVQA
jgi:hypothetical protein